MNQLRNHAALSAMLLTLLTTRAFADSSRAPRWKQVTLAPVTIQAKSFEDAQTPANMTSLLSRLSASATAEAETCLLQHKLAGDVERNVAQHTNLKVLGTITMPLALPKEVRGTKAYFREGIFATAIVTFQDRQGTTLATQSVALKWNEARWTRGGPKLRRNRALEDVLEDFVRRAVHIALAKLSESKSGPVSATRTHSEIFSRPYARK